MISLTYFSSAVSEFSEPDLMALLALSRANNEVLGLTGVLFYSGGHFVQTLEGEQVDVERLLHTIEQDPRHRDVLVAVREDIDERDYPDWSMGFARASAGDLGHLPGFNDYLEHGVQAPSGGAGKARIFHRVFRERLPRAT